MLHPVSRSTSPTKTTISGFDTNMTSYPDDDVQSIASSMPPPTAPPPTGPNTVVGDKLPTVEEISHGLIASGPFRFAPTTPATSVAAFRDVPGGTVEESATPEETAWPEVVDEKIDEGLRRLAQYAKDMFARDRGKSKTIEQYYSERLAKLIKEGEIDFDWNYMK